MPPKKRQRTTRSSTVSTDTPCPPSVSASGSGHLLVDVQALSASLAGAVSQAVKDAMASSNTSSATDGNLSQQLNDANVDEAVDGHIQEIQSVATAGENAGTSQQTPSSRFESIAVPLGSRVTAKIKTKIWADEFVDFGALLDTKPQQEKYSLAISSNSSASTQPKLTIEPTQPSKRITGIY